MSRFEGFRLVVSGFRMLFGERVCLCQWLPKRLFLLVAFRVLGSWV